MRELAILCVDDEPTILHAITEELRTIVDDEIIIESALDADEALDICEEFDEDGIELALVISDCIMPGIQGDKFLEQVHNKYPNTYKVMLTGQADLNAIKYAINHANLFRYLTKPWELDDMKLTVQSALKGYQDNLELESYKKELEEKVEQRTKELKTAVDLVHEYALQTLVDKDGKILQSSQSFAKLCGVSKEYMESLNLFDTIVVDSCENCIEKIKDTFESLTEINIELQQQVDQNKPIWFDLHISPLQEENSGNLFSIKRYDITDKKHIQELSEVDVLTSLFNRRFFNSLVPKEIQRVKREKNSMAFLMIDVDHFKKYNDLYGHQKGDDALVSVASVLREFGNRGNDFVFRLGGEEFAILTSQISQEEILKRANGINEKLYQLGIEHKENSASPYLSTSIGVAFYEDGMINESMDEIIKAADEFLYKAKNNGRNQVILEKR